MKYKLRPSTTNLHRAASPPLSETRARRRAEPADRVAVLGFARSPFGKFGGSLREATLPELASAVVVAALARARGRT